MNEQKKLYRSATDRKVCGVCGGLAAYFGIDATLVRLAAALLIVFSVFSGLLLYIIAAIIMPEEP